MKGRLIGSVLVPAVLAVTFITALSSTKEPSKSTPVVTFNKDVAPIFFKSCAGCHRPGEAAPMSLLSYKEARPWAKSIREKVVSREMPPWHADPHAGRFANNRSLTQAEIDTVVAWVDGGTREGNSRDLPPAPKFVDGWNIDKPDLVLGMPDEYIIEATGPDEYQNFVIDPGFTEDKYVQMAEARPGNRKVVHHIVAIIQPPPAAEEAQKKQNPPGSVGLREQLKDTIFYADGTLRRVKADTPVHDGACGLPTGGNGNQADGTGEVRRGGWLCVFSPGMDPTRWAPGIVKRIPARSKIILQVHYSKATGKVEKDGSTLGLVFARTPPAQLVITHQIANHYFRIPPGADNHEVTACWTTKEDIHLLRAAAHMHYRGKAMEIKAFYPDGRSEVVLNVPRYSFAWQTIYSFERPLAIPKGTRFLVTGHFDNSEKNKYNPDPTQAVRWGDPTYDEMLGGLIEYTVDRPR